MSRMSGRFRSREPEPGPPAAVPWAPSWEALSFPRSPRGDFAVHEVRDAMLTRYSNGAIPTTERPDMWVRGAVYGPDAQLVTASQRMRGASGDRVAAVDPQRLPSKPQGEVLAGTWAYGGHWMGSFGHFITETLTNFWAPADGVAAIVCHRWITHPAETEPWQLELLGLAGWGDREVRLVHKEPVRVERLLVPNRAFVVGGWARPEAVELWRRVARGLVRPDGPRRVFLSRSRFNRSERAEGREARSTPERDADLDRDFAAAGFEVVQPETLPISEQIAVVAGAEVIAGAAGSALHLAAFATRPALVIEVGDTRSPQVRLVGQQIIDTACGHLSAFVPSRVPARTVLDALDLDTPPAAVVR